MHARDGGSIQGYLNFGGFLVTVPSWHRALALDASATPEFTHTPGQVSFTPDGKHLVVTTKANTNSLLVYNVGRFGQLSANPVIRTEAGTVPFAVSYDRAGATALRALAGTIVGSCSPPARLRSRSWSSSCST